MSGTLVSFMAMAICGRQLAGQLTTFQILFYRSLIGLVIIGFLLWHSNWKQVFTRHFKVHAIRNIAHFGGQFGWFYGIAFIPLAEVFALEFTVPIWTAVWPLCCSANGSPVRESRPSYSACGCNSDFAPGFGDDKPCFAGSTGRGILLCPVTHPHQKAGPGRYAPVHPFL